MVRYAYTACLIIIITYYWKIVNGKTYIVSYDNKKY